MPATTLKTIPLTWLLVVWGLDMVGKLPPSLGGHKFLLVAINKFIKWIEAKPVTNLEADTTVKFVSVLMHRFGIRSASLQTMYPTSLLQYSKTSATRGKFE